MVISLNDHLKENLLKNTEFSNSDKNGFQFLASCSIISYENDKFNHIMSLDDITPSDIRESFQLLVNRHMIFKANQGEGASGSFFFHSKDRRFIIKTLQGNEKKVLLKMLDDLMVHYEKNSDSLLARIYGMYTLKSQYFSSVDVIIMKNTAYMEQSKEKMVFDIKGSTVNRFVNLPD